MDDLEKMMRVGLGVAHLSPVAYFAHVCSIVKLAPLEEWRRLIPLLQDGKAETKGLLPKNGVVQKHAARQMAILLFAADQLVDSCSDLTYRELVDGLRDMLAEHANKREERNDV